MSADNGVKLTDQGIKNIAMLHEIDGLIPVTSLIEFARAIEHLAHARIVEATTTAQAVPVAHKPTEPRMTNARHNGCAFDGWQCFHCGEIFETRGAARDHFGFEPSNDPACRIKLGGERGLVMALRQAEQDCANAWNKLHEESAEAVIALQKSITRNNDAVRAAEELGYSRGLADAAPQTVGVPDKPVERFGDVVVRNNSIQKYRLEQPIEDGFYWICQPPSPKSESSDKT